MTLQSDPDRHTLPTQPSRGSFSFRAAHLPHSRWQDHWLVSRKEESCLKANLECLLVNNGYFRWCWPWSQSKWCSVLLFFKIIFLKSLDPLRSRHALPSGTVSSQRVPHMGQTCYSGPEMCKPGSSKTYTIPLPRTGLSQGVFCTKAAPTHFLDLGNLFLRTRRVMTDDKRQVQPINREWRSVRGNGHSARIIRVWCPSLVTLNTRLKECFFFFFFFKSNVTKTKSRNGELKFLWHVEVRLVLTLSTQRFCEILSFWCIQFHFRLCLSCFMFCFMGVKYQVFIFFS